MRAHMLDIFRLENVIFSGSPPFSSKITSKFPDGLNQERGTWYLAHTECKLSDIATTKSITWSCMYDIFVFLFSTRNRK
jgi:hypothetical protein